MAGARAICSATISFGLVSIPVKGYLAAKTDSYSFNMITPKGHRVKQKLVDAETGEEVQRSECISGYEVEKGKYITFTDEEIDSFSAEKNNVIEICEVVSNVSLSPDKVERALYLSPDKSDKAYKLLSRCLTEENKVAICKWYARGKDHLVAIAPVGGLLMMFQLFYKEELREFSIDFGKNSDPSDKEVSLGKVLISQLSSDRFDLSSYKDEYSSRVETAIAKKMNGEKLEAFKQEVQESAFDLAALLENSLKKNG